MSGIEKHAASTYAMLRIVAGFMFLFHGLQKIFGVLTDRPVAEMFSQSWFGGVIELVGGILVMIGLQTRLAAFICSGTMAVAYAQFHWKFAFNEAFFPIVNRGELAALYCFVFLLISAQGAGKWSVDAKG